MAAVLQNYDNNSYKKAIMSTSNEEDKNYKLVVKHIIQSWGYYDNYQKYIDCHNKNLINDFINHIVKLAEDGIKQLTNPKTMNPLTSDQQRNFETSIHCHICKKTTIKSIHKSKS